MGVKPSTYILPLNSDVRALIHESLSDPFDVEGLDELQDDCHMMTVIWVCYYYFLSISSKN